MPITRAVEALHQLARAGVANRPKAGDDYLAPCHWANTAKPSTSVPSAASPPRLISLAMESFSKPGAASNESSSEKHQACWLRRSVKDVGGSAKCPQSTTSEAIDAVI
jgi:hypothetical protein